MRLSSSSVCMLALSNLIVFFYFHITVNADFISIFTFFGMFLELASLWAYQKENAGGQTTQEKHEAGARAPLDAPIDAPVRYTPAPAGTV